MKKFILAALAVGIVLIGIVVLRSPSDAQAVFAPVYTLYDTNGNILKDGDVISADAYGDPDVYIIALKTHGNLAGYKRLFLNPAIFSFYGHLGGFAKVKPVTPATRDLFTTSGLFRNCETNDPKVWATEVTGEDVGVLHHVQISGDEAVQQDPYFFDKVFCINTLEENFYPKSITAYTHLSQLPIYIRSTPTPTPTCTPRPLCLDYQTDTTPLCYIPEPIGGWCPMPTPTLIPTPTPVPTIATLPPGCYFESIVCITTPCDAPVSCPVGTYDGAIIDSVTMNYTSDTPAIFSITIKGHHPNTCYGLETTSVVRSGNTFNIFVRGSVQFLRCVDIPSPFEQTIPLNVTGLPFGRYQVLVNGVYRNSFTLPILFY